MYRAKSQSFMGLRRVGFAAVVVWGLFPSVGSCFSWVPSKLDYYLLPEYCKAKMSFLLRDRAEMLDYGEQLLPPAALKHWSAVLGPDYRHVHHYCHGLALMKRAEDPRRLASVKMGRGQGRATRTSAYEYAVKEIAYTRNASRPGHPLWERMSIDYARALNGAGRSQEAGRVFSSLVEQYPENPDVWVEFAKSQKRRGQLNPAIATLEAGLKRARNQGPLLFWLANYYYELGDLAKAADTAALAEANGMKVDRLRRKLGDRSAAGRSGSDTSEALPAEE